MENRIYDLIGIGFGVSNIGLAIALRESDSQVKALFIEANRNSLWQPNMLISGADIQNSPHRDLITPCNPRSKYTFMNYLFEHGRLFEYFNLNLTHPLRVEYSDYIKWCSEDFGGQVIYGDRVESLDYYSTGGPLGVLFRVTTRKGRKILAKNVSIGTGRQINIPEKFQGARSSRIAHLTEYSAVARSIPFESASSVAVIGSGQSAIEIILDLRKRFPKARIANICTGFGYKLKDTSPFSYEVFYPQFIDFFHALSSREKEEVAGQLRSTNYSTVDYDVLHELYLSMYEDRLVGVERTSIQKNSAIESVNDTGLKIEIETSGKYDGQSCWAEFDFVFLATGFIDYQLTTSPLTKIPLLKNIARSHEGALSVVTRDYRIEINHSNISTQGSIYLNGLCETTHGMGDAGSISSVSTRSAAIAKSLLNSLAAAIDQCGDGERGVMESLCGDRGEGELMESPCGDRVGDIASVREESR